MSNTFNVGQAGNLRPNGIRPVCALAFALTLHAATIRGTVVENSTGRPLARATVTVSPAGGNSEFRGATPDAIVQRQQRNRSVRTNPSGIFEFASLPAGTYLVSASKQEFVQVSYGQKHWFSPGMPIVLEADDEASFTIRMPRFGVITGTVLDENDVGLPGHEVALYTNTRPPRMLARSATDDRGMYRLFDLRPGRYLVRSLAKAYDEESYLPTFYRDSPTVDSGRFVEVKLDEEAASVDFHPMAGRLFTVSGRVSSAYGLPIVTLTSDTGPETASVDGHGNFSFNPMAPGTYELQAEIPSDRQRRRMASFQMLTVDRDLSDVSVALSPLPSVSITFEDTAGHAMTVPDGALMARRKDAAGESTATAFQNEGPLLPGRWEFALKNQVTYCVVGFQAPRQERAHEGRFDGWNEILVVPGTQNVVKFVLSKFCGAIAGTVKNANGDGVAGIPVFVDPIGLETRVITDSKGQYSLNGLVPGEYRLLASFDYLTVGPAQFEAASAPKITVEGGARASLDLDEVVVH